MAPTTAAERQRQYRARINSDPERRAKYLERERQRWKERVETGKEKSINELTPRQQRAKHKSWRNAYKRSKVTSCFFGNMSFEDFAFVSS